MPRPTGRGRFSPVHCPEEMSREAAVPIELSGILATETPQQIRLGGLGGAGIVDSNVRSRSSGATITNQSHHRDAPRRDRATWRAPSPWVLLPNTLTSERTRDLGRERINRKIAR
jgi:hypothetical protein